jgi:aspartyl-tRNA synthetase
MRTHTCGELRKDNAGSEAVLCGWVDSVRIQGKVAFIDIRDRYGKTQLFLAPKFAKDVATLKKESVIKVRGEVKVRPEANPNLPTGEVEVKAEEFELISAADPLPMQLEEDIESTEETRLKYRYLDLRRPEMRQNLITRAKLTKAFHDFFTKEGFVHLETPILAKSTPEGARDFIVPSRLQKGKFFALPQAPQLFKQLLMVAGFDKYYQIARCFRDEDLRADRQLEFTQLDIEMSFVDQKDVLDVTERAIKHAWKEVLDVKLKKFPVLTYQECMEKYNTDQPDLRKNKDDPKEHAFVWVVDFPMFEYNEDQKRWFAKHHPFTMPHKEDIDKMNDDPGAVRAKAYDLVCNGMEICSGSIRCHIPELQKKIFDVMKLSEDEVKEKFGFLLEAFRYGVPPHGGVAPGLDRLAAIATGNTSIKEVIAFPVDKAGKDLMLDAPSVVDPSQLDELGLRFKE